MKRQRRPVEPGEFHDPLKDYSPPDYADALERSLAEDDLSAVPPQRAVVVGPDDPVAEALRRMVAADVAAVCILDGDRVAGIFSEHDVVTRVAERFDTLADRPIREVMTPDPVCVHESDTPARALNLMSTGGFRHVPVMDADERLTGIVGVRRVVEYLQRHFD